jgi:hypothetical protein
MGPPNEIKCYPFIKREPMRPEGLYSRQLETKHENVRERERCQLSKREAPAGLSVHHNTAHAQGIEHC